MVVCHVPLAHDDVIKWKHFPRYWPFVRGIHRSPVNSPHKGQWRGALMFTLICARINGWVNNREAGDLRRYRAHYDVIVMQGRFDTYGPLCKCALRRSTIITIKLNFSHSKPTLILFISIWGTFRYTQSKLVSYLLQHKMLYGIYIAVLVV